MNRPRGGLFRSRSITNRPGVGGSSAASQASNDDNFSQSTMQSEVVQETPLVSIEQTTPSVRMRFARRSSLDLHSSHKQQQQQPAGAPSAQQQQPPQPKKNFFRRASLQGNAGPGVTVNGAGAEGQPQPQPLSTPKMGVFQRRSSLQGNNGGGEQQQQQQAAAPKMNVFQRRSSLQGNNGGPTPTAAAASATPTSGGGVRAAGGAAGRMFRRASLGAVPNASLQPDTIVPTDTASTSSQPKGDAVPRPVSRRASIGEDNSAAAAAMLDSNNSFSRPQLAGGSGFDYHKDSTRKIIVMTEAPRRSTSRRSSVGPGITVDAAAAATPLPPPPPTPVPTTPSTPNTKHRKNKLFANPFRRRSGSANGSSRGSSKRGTNTTGEMDDASSQASHSRGGGAGGDSESVSSRCSSQAPSNQYPHHQQQQQQQPREIIIPQQGGGGGDGDDDYDDARDALTVSPMHSLACWRPEHQDIQEDEELMSTNLPPSVPFKEPTVKFASEPRIHYFDFTTRATDRDNNNIPADNNNNTPVPSRSSSMEPEEDDDDMGPELSLPELKNTLWWNSEEMARIRQECMELVRDYLDDTDYMDAVTKLFSSHKKSVTAYQVQTALDKIAQHSHARGLEMHICPRGGLLCEKHRRIVLTNVASTTVDGLSNTGEGWILIRKESMKASRPCRQYALKMAEHDAMEAIEATMSHWSSSDEGEEESEDESESEEADDEPGPDPEQGPEDVATPAVATETATSKSPTATTPKSSMAKTKKKKSSSSSSRDLKKKKKSSSSSKTKLSGSSSKSSSSKTTLKKDVAPRTPRKELSSEFTPEDEFHGGGSSSSTGEQQASGEGSSQEDTTAAMPVVAVK